MARGEGFLHILLNVPYTDKGGKGRGEGLLDISFNVPYITTREERGGERVY